MEKSTILFPEFVKSILGEYFSNKKVLNIGPEDNRNLFYSCDYYESNGFKLFDETYDTVISTNYFHLNQNYKDILKNIYKTLKPNGLLLFTCDTVKKNLTILDLNNILNLNSSFSEWNSYYNSETHELYFVGIKKDINFSHTEHIKLTEYKYQNIINTTNIILKFSSTVYTSRDYKYSAVIVEPRKHAAFSFVLKNFFENLSDDWGLIIFHGCTNKDFLENYHYNQENQKWFTKTEKDLCSSCRKA